jgi:hypothetical protein
MVLREESSASVLNWKLADSTNCSGPPGKWTWCSELRYLSGPSHLEWETGITMTAAIKLIIAVCGIFGSFSYFALLQEDLFKKEYAGVKFKSTFFMMVAERGVNAAVALVFIMVRSLQRFEGIAHRFVMPRPLRIPVQPLNGPNSWVAREAQQEVPSTGRKLTSPLFVPAALWRFGSQDSHQGNLRIRSDPDACHGCIQRGPPLRLVPDPGLMRLPRAAARRSCPSSNAARAQRPISSAAGALSPPFLFVALTRICGAAQVLGKSCKMVPVMLFGILIGGKWNDYGLTDYVQVILVTVGVVIFNFGAPVKPGKGGGSDSSYGLALIAGSLALDGCTGGLQDRVKKSTALLNKAKPGAKCEPPRHPLVLFRSRSLLRESPLRAPVCTRVSTLRPCRQQHQLHALIVRTVCAGRRRLSRCFTPTSLARSSPLASPW